MPKVYESNVVFDFSPSHVVNFLLRKYPNPFATHVYSVDTLSRNVDPTTGLIRTERLIGVQQSAPGWIKKLFSLPETAYVREVVFIDPSEPKATCMSMNLSLKQYVACLELITYSPYPPSGPIPPSPEPGVPGPGGSFPSTHFYQRALITSGFSSAMIARRIEKASVERFGKNAGVGKKGFEWVLAGGQR